jgi:hypothetical protein
MIIVGGEWAGSGPKHAGVEALGAAVWEGACQPVEVAPLSANVEPIIFS